MGGSVFLSGDGATCLGLSVLILPIAAAGSSYRCQKKSIECNIKHMDVTRAVYEKPKGKERL
jgi:hypothetical protein